MLENQSTPGNISFATAREAAAPSGRGGVRNIIVGDLNGDGWHDVAWSSQNAPGGGGVFYVLNTTSSPGSTITFAESFGIIDISGITPPPQGPDGIDIGDVNGDGKLDILLSSISGNGPYLALNTSTSATAVSFTASSLNFVRSRNVRIADMNLDGKGDFILANAARAEDGGNIGIHILSNARCMQPVITPNMGTACDGVDFFIETTKGAGADYTWELEPVGGGSSTRENTGMVSRLNLLDLSMGNYTITVTATVGDCRAISGATQQFRRTGGAVLAPSLSLGGGGAAACSGNAGRLIATLPSGVTADAHHWTGPGGTMNGSKDWDLGTLSADQAGTYRYYYETSVGGTSCPSQIETLVLEVRNLPNLSITSTSPYGCEGSSFSVALRGVGHELVNVYQWMRDGSPIAGQTSLTYTATQAGSYVLNYGDGTCNKNSKALVVSQVTPPTVTFMSPENWCRGASYMPTVNAMPSESATMAGLSRLSYQWDMGDGTSLDLEPEEITHRYTEVHMRRDVKVRVAYQNFNSCATTEEHRLRIVTHEDNALSISKLPDKTRKCPTETVILTAPRSILLSGGGFTTIGSYVWNTGATIRSVLAREPGNYMLTVQDDAGCILSASVDIENIENSGITLDAMGYTFQRDTLRVVNLMEGEKVNISLGRVASGSSSIMDWRRVGRFKENTPTYLSSRWGTIFANALDTTNRVRPVLTGRYDDFADGPIIFRVRAQDAADCNSEAFISMTVVPKNELKGYTLFTPNNDGRLDKWNIYRLDVLAVDGVSCQLHIYDRRGNEVFSDRVDGTWQGWDGTSNGQLLADNIYFYTLECNCQKLPSQCPDKLPPMTTGNFLLLRRGGQDILQFLR